MVSKENLAEIAIFSDLNEADRDKIAAISQRKEYLKDTSIISQVSPGGQLFMVHKGEIKIIRSVREKQEQTLTVLRSGDFFGGVSFVDGKMHSASAVCIADTVVFIIDKDDFDQLSEKDPVLGVNILKRLTLSLCAYLRTMNLKFYDMVQYVSLAR